MIDFLTNDKVFSALISAITTVIVFFLTLFTKKFIETSVLSSKLETEHKFGQRKKIKEVLAKNKIHLLTSCEILNHRLWNFANNHQKNWIKINGDYSTEHYYLHSFAYRILVVFAWIKKINKEMIYLNTTIATKDDLDFIKFLRIFPEFFCDLTFIEGNNADGDYAIDHFFKNNFDLLPDSIIRNDEIIPYSVFIKDLGILQNDLRSIYKFLDGISPNEDRKRWDRLHLFNLTLIIFLNNYGYDFQKISNEKFIEALTKPRISPYLKNYFELLKEYKLDKNKNVIKLEKIARKYYK